MITMRFEGGEELAAALAKLPAKLSKKVLVEALKGAAEPIRKAASAHAARRAPAPDLADHIGVAKAEYGEQATVKVGPEKGFAYGLPLEIGTIDTPAQPFMRPAFDANAEKSLKLVGDAIWVELAGAGVSRSSTMDTDVEDLGATRKQATTAAAFKGKQRPYKPRKPRAKK